jgi:peptide/nickel transport system ATP-binding protein
VQAEILNLLSTIKSLHAMTMILVSHDMGVIAHMCDRAGVMGEGRIERTLGREELDRL